MICYLIETIIFTTGPYNTLAYWLLIGRMPVYQCLPAYMKAQISLAPKGFQEMPVR
jgi:hypothetical protein